MQVTFMRIQKSSIKSKQNMLPSKTMTYKKKTNFRINEYWLREVFRLIVATRHEIRKTIHEL